MEKMTKILICDENEDFRRITGDYLKTAGIFTCDFAKNGDEALEKIAKNHPDIVIIDIWMRGLDKLDLCRRYRRNWRVRFC